MSKTNTDPFAHVRNTFANAIEANDPELLTRALKFARDGDRQHIVARLRIDGDVAGTVDNILDDASFAVTKAENAIAEMRDMMDKLHEAIRESPQPAKGGA